MSRLRVLDGQGGFDGEPSEAKRRCSKCREMKPLAQFAQNRGAASGYGSHCRACMAAYYRANEAKAAAYNRRRLYGMSDESYQQLLDEQNGVCAICGEPPTSTRFKRLSVDHDHETGETRGLLCNPCKRLSVDHDHETGETRGLLCNPCNSAIGQFKENPVRMMAAMLYLLQHKGIGASDKTGIPHVDLLIEEEA